MKSFCLQSANLNSKCLQSSWLLLLVKIEFVCFSVGVDDTLDTSGNITGSDYEDDADEGGMRFSELLSDPDKEDITDQDPPSSTTGDQTEKPGKRSNQGE